MTSLQTKVLIGQREIQMRVAALGASISQDYAGQDLVVVSVLKGAFMFTADLLRALTIPVELEFIGLKSYEGTASTGNVQVTVDLGRDIRGRHVLVIEDIVDTGHTVRFLQAYLGARQPASLKVCTFLSKPDVHQGSIELPYVGFSIPKAFVIGYGLDLDGRYRESSDLLQVLSTPT